MDKGRTWRSILSAHSFLSRCLTTGKVAKEDRETAREKTRVSRVGTAAQLKPLRLVKQREVEAE